MIARCKLLRLATGVALAAFAGASPGYAQKMVLKTSDLHPEGHPTVVALTSFGKKLEAATNDRLSIQIYPSMRTGGEKEAIEQAQVGAVALARVSVGALSPMVDGLNVFNLPYLFRSTAHMQKMIDGPIGRDLLNRVTSNPMAGLVGLCWMDAGARSLYDTRKPIRSVDDLKGMKFRVMGNPIFVDMMNALGASGVSMGDDRVFSALQTGVVDGAENSPPSFVFDNHYTVAKYYTLDEHLIVPEILVMSKRVWESLTPADQALVEKFSREAQMEQRVLWAKFEKDAMDKAKAAGVTVIEIGDKKPFQASVKPVWDKYGPKYADMVKRIQAVE